MGRNRRWVLKDSIQDALWKTILRGPRPPSVRWEKRRCQHCQCSEGIQDGGEVERLGQGSESCAIPATIQSSVSSGDTCGSSCQGPTVASLSVLGDADAVEKENLERALSPHRRKLWCHPCRHRSLYERIHRPGEETVGCRRGGSSRCCPESRRVHQSLGRGREAPRRIAVAGEEFCRTCPRQAEAQVAELQAEAKVFQRHAKLRVCPVDVKSIPPNTENSMQYGYDETDNNNMSNETKRETNYSINNNNTRYMQLSKYGKYTSDDICTNACVVHMIH